MNLEVEVVQPIYVQKIKIFGHVWWLAIFHQGLSGFSCTYITNFGHVRCLAIDDVDIFHQDVSGFSCTYITHIGHVDIFCHEVYIFRALK